MTPTANTRRNTPARHPQYGLILHWVDRATRQGMPGLPPSQVPMVARKDLHAALTDGAVQLVGRPSATRPGHTASFIVRTGAVTA